MNLFKLVLILFLSITALIMLFHNYRRGLAFTVFALFFAPVELFFDFGGNIPTLTTYRALMMVLIVYAVFGKNIKKQAMHTPLVFILSIILFLKLISLIKAASTTAALDDIIIFAFESFVFYLIIINGVDDSETLNKLLNAIVYATVIIAILGFIEYYTDFSPVDYITLSDRERLNPDSPHDVFSTFPHPILFGTALAMGWPICLWILDRKSSTPKKIFLWLGTLIIYGSAYFSHSRGPWISFIFAILILLILRYSKINRKLAYIALFVMLVFTLRPGVYDTMSGLIEVSTDPTQPEGTSFLYRIDLYHKAMSEVEKSPWRFLFGYGDGAHHALDLSGPLSFNPDRIHDFWSWDSEFAIILLEGGWVGFIMHIILYSYMLIYLLKRLKYLDQEYKDLVIVCITTVSVYILMMTNVSIFAPQLTFLFWLAFGVGVKVSHISKHPRIIQLYRYVPSENYDLENNVQ